jgi:hypothetical protein
MAKYRVALRGRNVLMRDEETGAIQRAGFHVNCYVDASDAESAGITALDILRRHPRYALLGSWPESRGADPPPIEVESIDRVPWLSRRVPVGITAGFAFYVDKDERSK